MESEKVINAYCGCTDGKGIWFIHRVLPVLFYYSFGDNKIAMWKVIPIENELRHFPFSSIIKAGEKLYIIAGSQDKSFIYDTITEKFEELKNTGIGPNSCHGAYLRNNYICVLPLENGVAKRICLENLKTQDGANWRELYNGATNIYLQNLQDINENGEVFIPVINTNTYVKYDIDNDSWEKIEIKDRSCNCTALAINHGWVYVYDENCGNILKIDTKGNVIKKQHIETRSMWIYSFDDFILADEVCGDRIILLNNELDIIATINKELISSDFNDEWENCLWLKTRDGLCGILKDNRIIFVNKNGIEKEISISISENDWNEIRKDCMRNTSIQRECNWIGLKNFMEIKVCGVR